MVQRRVWGWLLGSMMALAGTGCAGTVGPVGPVLDLAEARARWEGVGPESYEFAVLRSCFCPKEWRGPVRVAVSSGVAVDWTYVDEGTAVPESLQPHFPTVAGLFDVLEDAYERQAETVRVTYDAETGAPVEIWIDYQSNVADEELGFTIVESVHSVG